MTNNEFRMAIKKEAFKTSFFYQDASVRYGVGATHFASAWVLIYAT